jgi:predicted AAA+ superfamily ATPase
MKWHTLDQVPHLRKRHIESYLKLALKASPIVGVLGQRQTGKSTILAEIAGEYVTCDDSSVLAKANADPESFLLSHQAPFTIDECQLAPPLFPALKEYVRKHPARGQFLLSGSVRFTSRKAIRESLTGRILTLELLPFTISEMHGSPLVNPTDPSLLARAPRFTEAQFQLFSETGGMPGISFRRNSKMTARLWEDHVNTLLDRDLKLIIQTSVRLESLKKLMRSLAETVGEPLDLSKLSRETRISRVTMGKLIPAFEAMFLIRLIPCEGGLRTPRVFFEDVGMARYLAPNSRSQMFYKQAFYQCARAWFTYSTDARFEFFEYQTRDGLTVDLAVRDQKENRVTGWIFAQDSTVDDRMLKSARSFLKAYASNTQVMILGPSIPYQKIEAGIVAGCTQNLL